MRIVMFTNTYAPHVGGVARSVAAFADCYRERGHEVLVIAPEFEGQPEEEAHVIRIPALQNFNGSDFSVALTAPAELSDRLDEFQPQLVHAHHPFLLGNEAVRVARRHERPLVFTHHTLYEQYTHYVPADSSLLRRFVVELGTRFANLCDHVFAPSESVARLLEERGVEVPLTVVPTGVDYAYFNEGDGSRIRTEWNIDPGAFVVGHAGRLAPEKNLEFLAEAVVKFIGERENAVFLLAGRGPSEEGVIRRFETAGLGKRIVTLGELDHDELRDAYAAMDVFAFASKSETQGMVLAEAMATGAPVVALDANGAREIVEDRSNGRLIQHEDIAAFAGGIDWVYALQREARGKVRRKAQETAGDFSLARCADQALATYSELVRGKPRAQRNTDPWKQTAEKIAAEWEILTGGARALGTAAVDELVEGGLSDDQPGTI